MDALATRKEEPSSHRNRIQSNNNNNNNKRKISAVTENTEKPTTATTTTPTTKQRSNLKQSPESQQRVAANEHSTTTSARSAATRTRVVMGGGFAAAPTRQMHEKLQQQLRDKFTKIGNTESSSKSDCRPQKKERKESTSEQLEVGSEPHDLRPTKDTEKPPAKSHPKIAEKPQKPQKESKFAAKLRRSFRRAEHKSVEIKSASEAAKNSDRSAAAFTALQRQASGEPASLFAVACLPGLGGYINPALLLDSPEEATPPEFNYRHLSSVATTNSNTSIESNDCCADSSLSSPSCDGLHLANASMGGDLSTGGGGPALPTSSAAAAARHRPKLRKQSSSHSDGEFVNLVAAAGSGTHATSSRSCSTTSDSSSAKLTRLQNFLFKSSGDSSRSYLGHSNDGFTASSHNSSSGEWEHFTNVGSCSEAQPAASSVASNDGDGGNYYQYTLTSPTNPFLPEITARTYHSSYDEQEEDAQHAVELEELDANVTSVKYVAHPQQRPSPLSEPQDSAASTPGRQKRKLFQLCSPQTNLQPQTAAATGSTMTAAAAASRSLNPFLCDSKATSAAAEVAGGSSTDSKRLPLRASSPVAAPQDLNARREEFLRATMKICLVVSPPSSKLQLKSKSLTHLDGLDSTVACQHGSAAAKAANHVESPSTASTASVHRTLSPLGGLIVATPTSHRKKSAYLQRKKPLLTRSEVSSSEFFSVSFCTESGYHEEEFIPASKGVSLKAALSQTLRQRNLSFSQITIIDNNSQDLLETGSASLANSLDESTEVEHLAGHHLIVSERDGSRKTLQKAASFGSRARPPRLLSSASTEESTEASDQRVISGKQLKQRWSGLFGIRNPQQSQLCELLNSYAKMGVPQPTAALNFDHPDFDAAQEYLDHVHKSWKDLVQCDEMSDGETKIQIAIWELVTTEVYYIHALQTVTDLFLACLEAVQEEKLLTDVDQQRLFSNVRDICEANMKFWTLYLYPMVANSIATGQPLRIDFFQPGFSNFAAIFAPYKKYCAEQSTCQFYCKELNRSNALFTSYLAWCESQKMCDRLRLADILVRPMQRLTKYGLLLAAIKKHMTDEEDIETVDTMIQTVENFVCSVNNHLTTRQETERLKGVMARIECYDVVDTNNETLEKMVKQHSQMFDLCAPMKGCATYQVRHLFMEGDHKFKDHLGKADVHCFLLTDMLLVCKSIAKKGLGALKVIRQPFLTDRLMVQHSSNTNVLSCVYLNELHVAVAAFTLQCSEAKNWYESLKRTKTIYTRLKQGGHNYDGFRFGVGPIAGGGTADSLSVKKSPLNSSIGSHVTSTNNSHSGSAEWNDSRNISVDFDKTNSLSSDEGSNVMGISHAFALRGKNAPATTSQKLPAATSSANTLSVQPINLLGQSLPNLNLHPNQTNLYHSYSNNTLLVPGTTSSHSGNLLLSPTHRGISYPPPTPARVPLRRGMAFSASIKNPPLLKTRNITSQNSINWHQIPATPTSPHTSQRSVAADGATDALSRTEKQQSSSSSLALSNETDV